MSNAITELRVLAKLQNARYNSSRFGMPLTANYTALVGGMKINPVPQCLPLTRKEKSHANVDRLD